MIFHKNSLTAAGDGERKFLFNLFQADVNFFSLFLNPLKISTHLDEIYFDKKNPVNKN
jgi:hypothetical protein